MASNYGSDQEMERALREHFEAEAEDLRAPQNLWQSIEGQMDLQPTRHPVTQVRRKILGALKQNWFPMMATGGAVAVAASAVFLASRATQDELQYEASYAAAPAAPAAAAAPAATAAPAMAMPAATPAERVVIKEVPVERVVEKTVVKEVPVERVVRETVVKEVPVEKVVTREVFVEKVVEKVVQVEAAPMKQTPPPAAAAAAPQAAAPQRAATPAPARPPATTFQDYTRQPFVATAEDAVSTFSLDTDRTSYQLALSWLQEGYEIEPDSVRAEEWINAFDYQYELPPDDWGFAITSDVAMHPLDGSKHLVRIGFQAAEVADDRPLNVTLVLDASGSMGDGNRVDIARAAAEAIRQSLRPQDRLAVVHFTEGVIHELTVEHTSPDASVVQRSIQRLAPHGSTNVQAGLNQGVRLADRIRHERPEAYNYVILMSDGVANVDATNPFAILESAYDRNALNPLRLITIGVGINNYNDVLLEQLAQHGNGWYRYLDNTGQAQATFSRDNWLALSTPFADQTRAQVTWDPDLVRSWRIIGYENRVTSDQSFAEDRKEFAEIPSGAATTVFYEIELHDLTRTRAGQEVTLANVELRWVVAETGQSRSQRSEVRGRLDSSLRSSGDPLLELGAIVALSADRYGGLYDGDYVAEISSDLTELEDRLRSLNSSLGGLGAYQDFRFMLEHMAERARAQAPPAAPTGYSR
ncbi:MAG: von Willebrand factor type A domain-containing protein [Chloroflexota bacterium]|nr:von Willebrand factor type A domain-containing protein [Chloroflexota bacterium]MDE2920429.1 von Willebrand factor type A domain-containing protein [Chloroflexota bacterium]